MPGYQHDSNVHYLSIATTATEITVPVELGESYSWWVHRPGSPATVVKFSVAPMELTDPELIDGRYRATALELWKSSNVDVAPLLQHCINQVPVRRHARAARGPVPPQSSSRHRPPDRVDVGGQIAG